MQRIFCEDQDFLGLDFDKVDSYVLSLSDSKRSSKEMMIRLEQGSEFLFFSVFLDKQTEGFSSPYYGSHISEVPPKSYFVITKCPHGFTVYFCLSHQGVISSLAGSNGGLLLSIEVQGRSRFTDIACDVFFCKRGKNLHQTIEQVMNTSLFLTKEIGKPIENKLAPPTWLGGLGWESGIALGADVTHDAILSSVKSLADAGYRPSYVLIDEGWQQLEPPKDHMPQALENFDADKIRFPYGIAATVKHLRELGVEHIGVWHGMMGYRGGVGKTLAEKYSLERCKDGRYYLGSNFGRTFEFFYDYYDYLRHQGLDFIKVGDQGTVQTYAKGADTTLLYKNLQAAMQAAASVQFNSAHFNTECLHNENLFYWGTSRLARTAEDIDILNPVGMMRAIRNNLSNTLWMQYLMQPDFDAWLTQTDQSETLAIFHALSGSINVIGDLPGAHNHALLDRFVLPNGSVLRTDKPLTLSASSVFINPLEEKGIYKAFTFKRSHGILGVFNLSPGKKGLHGTVCPGDVEGIIGEHFALFSHQSGFVKVVGRHEEVEISLKPNQSDVITFAPLHSGVAVWGFSPFYVAPGPIIEVDVEDNEMHLISSVAARLVIYCEREVFEVRRDGHAIPWDYDKKRNILSIDIRSRIVSGHFVYTIVFE